MDILRALRGPCFSDFREPARNDPFEELAVVTSDAANKARGRERILKEAERLATMTAEKVCAANQSMTIEAKTPAAFLDMGVLAFAYYLSAPAADGALIERLLWPERFYNANSVSSFVGLMFMPLGGPTLGVALRALDFFVANGIGSIAECLCPLVISSGHRCFPTSTPVRSTTAASVIRMLTLLITLAMEFGWQP